MKYFFGLVAITVLLWNLGYEETLKLLSEAIGVRVSELLSLKYKNKDLKSEKRITYNQNNKLNINIMAKFNKESRKRKEREDVGPKETLSSQDTNHM